MSATQRLGSSRFPTCAIKPEGVEDATERMSGSLKSLSGKGSFASVQAPLIFTAMWSWSARVSSYREIGERLCGGGD
jgi:hypothetical protein